MPEPHVTGHERRPTPDRRDEQRPARRVPPRGDVDHEQRAAHRRPRHEPAPQLAHDLRLAARREHGAVACPVQPAWRPIERPPRPPRPPAVRRRQRPGCARRRRRAGATRLVQRRAPRLERAPQRIGRGPAILGVLLERAHHAGGQVFGQFRPLVRDHRRPLGDVLHQDARNRRRVERELPHEHLIGHHTEAVDVRAAVHLAVAGGLLGAHIMRRPDRDARTGQRRPPGRGRERLCDSEVRHHHATPAPLEQDVVGLHVAMDDPECVRGPEGIRRLLHDATGFVGGQSPTPLQLRRQRLPVHVRHHEVDQPIRSLPDGVDRHDVRVRQPSRGLRLAHEAQSDLFAKGELGREDLDGDLALQTLVAGLEDHSHPAPADLPVQGIRAAQRLSQAGGE